MTELTPGLMRQIPDRDGARRQTREGWSQTETGERNGRRKEMSKKAASKNQNCLDHDKLRGSTIKLMLFQSYICFA
jgi:TnpA family transposase